MTEIIGAIFFVIVTFQNPQRPPIQLSDTMPLDECMVEAAAFLSAHHDTLDDDGEAMLQAGCIVTHKPRPPRTENVSR